MMLRLGNGLRIMWLRWRLALTDYSGAEVFIGKGSKLLVPTEIGDGTRINGSCIAKGAGKLLIGKYCAIGDGVRFITSNHNLRSVAIQYALQRQIGLPPAVAENMHISVGHDVWIGDGAILLPGISVGSGSVIGAGSVVTKDVDPYTVVAGNPARVIRKRAPDDLADYLLRLAWWDWPKERILESRSFFSTDLETASVEGLRASLEATDEH
ncbi:MAG: antibiotic acetyltransferase [Deltaproteobacteria bacterium]|nr:MAG: antibiotic acetyltransferase [Deltaproteobacteria bacterium]